jgi:hypothetical protein
MTRSFIERASRVALTAMALFFVSCGGGDDPDPIGGGSIQGSWKLATVGGEPVPTLMPGTTLTLDHGSATFSDPGFTMTYAGSSEGEPQVITINGTWSSEGNTYRLFGSMSINGVYATGYSNVASVINGVLTQYGEPAETWVR